MLHLIKLAVGARSVEDIARHQAMRAGTADTVGVQTRQCPKRAAALLDGGSLFWVVAGLTAARQRLRGIDEVVRDDGSRGTLLTLDRRLVAVATRRVRAFQGWRYLDGADAAPDAHGLGADDENALPAPLRRALVELCLL